MSTRPATVVLDTEAIDALAGVHHAKHRAVLALIEVTNQRRARNERMAVLVPTAVRIEAGWDRTDPRAAMLNRISRAVDVSLDRAGANRGVGLRRLVSSASVVDVTVARAAEAAALQPATIVTSDGDDMTSLVAQLEARVGVTVI